MKLAGLLLTAVVLSAAGCSSISASKTGDGIPFYPGRPYLVLTKAEGASAGLTGVLSYEIVYLPDLGNEYHLHAWSFMGSVQSSIKLKDGWALSESESKTEDKSADLVKALSDLMPKLLAFLPGVQAKAKPAGNKIEIYEIKLDKGLHLSPVPSPGGGS